ncbi:hypothetical protein COU61_04735 [Candidatus Pacearchaeota archaeon CG10_big_fil_rev_8_21_14_0_10_35_13]|nr:MAG: hypothetical protein COU61_04735 [Candidatus Pacearchaeota archaeon CG10_big_fil_rev_8_21_14_0_10_35_13]
MTNKRFLEYAKRTANPEVPELRKERPIHDTSPRTSVRGSFSDYQEFCGKNTEQMPLLISSGRVPMSVFDLLEKRTQLLTSRNPDKKEFDYFMNNYFDTGDGVVYMPNGDLIVAYDSERLRNMDSASSLVNGALDLSGFDISRVSGKRFSKSEVENMVKDTELSLSQVNEHLIWLALAHDDKALLKKYSESFFKYAKKELGYDTNMGVYLGSPAKVPIMRAWFVSRANSKSDADGGSNLDAGRLLGLASETQK